MMLYHVIPCFTHKENPSPISSDFNSWRCQAVHMFHPVASQSSRVSSRWSPQPTTWFERELDATDREKGPLFPVELSHRPSRSKLFFPLNPDDIQRILRCSSTSTWPGVAKNWCLFYLKSGWLSLCRCNFDDLGPSAPRWACTTN